MSSFGANSSTIGIARQPKRPTARDGETSGKQPLWIPMLQSASKGKDLPEKHLIVLGGSSEQQRIFLEHLNPKESQRRNDTRSGTTSRKTEIPISNKYALGYTYHDILDADHEDVLARLNVHMLTNPSGRFVPILKPLLSADIVKDILVVILLDWNDPFKWARELRQWTRLLRKVIVSLDEETKIELEQCMNNWKERRVGPDAQNISAQDSSAITLGPGEWDEGLGIPLAVVCVQSEKIQDLERDLGWGDDQFDFLQQWLRTVLLKHGASLVYIATGDANNVRTLVHSSLSIQSLLKKDVLKHNIIDRDKIMVPPNWDSWGKIRILREGYDPEIVSKAWSLEIQEEPEDTPDFITANPDDIQAILDASQKPTSAVYLFESSLPNPISSSSIPQNPETSTEITIVATSMQEFLQAQFPILEKLQSEDHEHLVKAATRPGYLNNPVPVIDGNERDSADYSISSRSVSPSKPPRTTQEHLIGPYQINVNGIDFDAEEATRRLRERESERIAAANAAGATSTSTSSNNNNNNNITTNGGAGAGIRTPTFTRTRTGDYFPAPSPGAGASTPSASGDGSQKPSNEALHGFFANLIKKGQERGSRGGAAGTGTGTGTGTGNVSGASSPARRRESPAPASASASASVSVTGGGGVEKRGNKEDEI